MVPRNVSLYSSFKVVPVLVLHLEEFKLVRDCTIGYHQLDRFRSNPDEAA